MSSAKVPPQNLDAEESVIGACLLASGALEAASEEITAGDFYREKHGSIFTAALTLYGRNEPVDAITVVDELTRTGELEKVGGREYVHGLVALMPTTSNVAHYARIVREAALLRRLITTGGQISNLGWEGEGEPTELIDRADHLLSALTEQGTSSSLQPMSATLDETIAEIREAYQSKTPIFGLKTGFTELDNVMTGLHPGTLTIVAARPSMGKSAFAQQISESVCSRGGNTAIFSLEMGRKELEKRMISRMARADLTRVFTGQLETEEAARIKEALPKMRTLNLFVDDDAGITLPELRTRCRRLKRTDGLDLVVLDYLQLVGSSGSHEENREREIARFSRGLKVLARELNLPIIALSQLNRAIENRSVKRPVLSDLRESGAIEQDADAVIFVHRPAFHDPDASADKLGDTELIVAKNRNGQANVAVKLTFVGRHVTFKTMPKGDGIDAGSNN